MRKFLKILFAFVVLVVAGVTAAVLLIPREQVVALAADRVRAATGRELVMSGDISPSFWPVLGVRTGPVRLSNADWGQAADMVSASAAEIGVELMPLFSGEVKVAKLRLIDPVVALEIGADGRPNWQFGDDAGTGHGGGGDIPKIALPEAVIENGSLSFHDARTGQRIELAALDLTAGLAGMEAPLTLDGAGLWNGKRASVTALVDTPAAAMQGRPVAVKLLLASDPASLGFEGTLHLVDGAALPRVEGAVSAKLASPAAAIAWATGAGAPQGLADIGAVKLEGTVTASDAGLRLTAKGSASYRERMVAYDLTADGAAGWLDRQAVTVALTAASKGLFEMSFSGPVSAGDVPSAEGPLTVAVADLRGLAQWASGAPLDTPAGSFETASLDTRLTLRGGDRLDFADLAMGVDDTALTGTAGVDLRGARPLVSARLESGPLDFSPFMAGGETGGGGGAKGWSTEPLDLSALRSVDADVAIRAEAVDLGQIEIGRSDIAAGLRDGRLDMDIRRVDAYGGGLSGTVAVIAGRETQVATDVTITQVQLRPLLNAMAGIDNLEGLGALRLRAEGRGGSMDSLVRSLDGDGALELTDGAILGLNLAALVRNLTGQGGASQRTDFSAVSGTFDITGGVLHNTDFSFLGPLLRVVGAGTVDLGAQTQNFRLEPTAVASLTGQGGALADSGLGIFPILVTGTWSNPSIRPDLTAAIQGLLSDPDRAIGAVTGLVKNADPGQAAGALIGAVTGGSEPDSPAGALGQALGGLLGGKRSSSSGRSERESGGSSGGGDTVPQPTYGGGVLGALGGGSASGAGAVPQPSYGGGAGGQTGSAGGAAGGPQEFDASEFAPALAPLPRPAAPGRETLAALPADQSGQPTGTARQDAGTPVDPPPEPALVPAPDPVPTPEPAPAAAPAPQPEPAPAQADPQPAPEPAPAAAAGSGTAQPAALAQDEAQGTRQTGRKQDKQDGRKREKDGGLTLDQILRGIQK